MLKEACCCMAKLWQILYISSASWTREEVHLKTYAEKEFLVEFLDCPPSARERGKQLLTAFQHPFLVPVSVPVLGSPTFPSPLNNRGCSWPFSIVSNSTGLVWLFLSVFLQVVDTAFYRCGVVRLQVMAAGCLSAVRKGRQVSGQSVCDRS